jgi:hypothetical protein
MLERLALGLVAAALTGIACAPAPAACPVCPTSPVAPPSVAAAPVAPTVATAPTPAPPPSAVASTAPPAPSASGAPSPGGGDDYCRPADGRVYGAWRATPDDVAAAIAKMRFLCASEDWVAQAVADCMARLGRVDVVVRAGVMDGDRATPNACDIAVGTVEWNGRRWIALENAVREQAALFDYTTSAEMTARGPVLSTTGCERTAGNMPGGANHPIVPQGWKTFPADVQQRLCH